MSKRNAKAKVAKSKKGKEMLRKNLDARAAANKKRLAGSTTTHKLAWRHVTARVRHTRNYINTGWSHIEIIVLTPKGAPVPITSTGYLSHFLDEQELARAGGPVRFFIAWLDREALTKAWAKKEAQWRQLELFPL